MLSVKLVESMVHTSIQVGHTNNNTFELNFVERQAGRKYGPYNYYSALTVFTDNSFHVT